MGTRVKGEYLMTKFEVGDEVFVRAKIVETHYSHAIVKLAGVIQTFGFQYSELKKRKPKAVQYLYKQGADWETTYDRFHTDKEFQTAFPEIKKFKRLT